MADKGTFYVSQEDEDVTLVASNSRDPNAVAALRMSTFMEFNHLSRCEWSNLRLEFNLQSLYNILTSTNDDELYVLNITWPAEDNDHDKIDFEFKESGSESVEYELPLTKYYTEVSDYQIPKWIDEDFNIYVGMFPERFTELIKNLVSYGTEVYAYVSADRVTFVAGNKDVVLKKKPGECNIQGVRGDDEVCLRFSVHYSKAILNAVLLTNHVCLRGRRTNGGGGSARLSYYIGEGCALGELMIFFP